MLVNNKLTNSLMLTSIFSAGLILMAPVSNLAFGYNFGAAGDWGCNSNTGKTASQIKAKSPERVFALGDYSYTSTASCWLDRISGIKSITRIAIGNHEDDPSEGFSQYMSAFGLSSTYYAYTWAGGTSQNARIIVMDSDRNSFSSGSSQYNFVLSELKKTGYKWKIVYIHKQFYTSPNTCGSSSCSNTASDTEKLRNTYHKYFDQYGVDLVLNGHLHNYQRTYPIKYDSVSPSSPIILSTSSTDYNDPSGPIFVTVGTGGINLHGLSGKSSFVKYQQDDRFGWLDLSTINNGDTLLGRYYTHDGVLRDTFRINKAYTASSYSYGPSLTLSGEAATTIVPSDDGSLGITGDGLEPRNNANNDIQTGQVNDQGEGLDCDHFTQEGPTRCRP